MRHRNRPNLRFKGQLGIAVFAALVALSVSAGAALAAPYKYEKAQSEELSKTVPGGAFAEPFALTFDAAGNLYVLDHHGNGGLGIVDKFSSENVFQAPQLGGEALDTEFTHSVAVNDETGHIYVGETEYITEPLFSDVVAMGADGKELSRWTGANTPEKTFGEGCCNIYDAVDNSSSASKGDVYVLTRRAGGEIDVIEPQEGDKKEGKFVRQLEVPGGFGFEGSGESITVDDATGQVYVTDNSGPLERHVVDRFSAEGVFETAIEGPTTGEKFKEPIAVAVDSASGNVFVVDHGFGGGGVETIDKLGASGQLLAQITQTGENEPLQHPVGLAVQQTGPHAGELYVADAAKKTVDVFAEEQPGAPTIESEGVQQLTGDSATFIAEINPRGAPTEYHIEYGPCSTSSSCVSSSYPSVVPVPDDSLGAEDFAGHTTPSFHVQGLSAGMTYHFRVVAHNEVKGKVEITEGKERTFSTQGSGGEFALPDGRAWELVSPPDKHGAALSTAGELGVIQAAADGNAIAYLANGPTEPQPQGAAGEVQVLSTRGAGGWSSRDIATPHEAATGDSPGTAPEYHFFSEDLSTSIVQPFGLFNPALSPGSSEQTPYLHALAGCTSNCFTPIVTGRAGFANVPAGTHFGEELECEENNGVIGTARSVCGPRFQGASPDGSHVVFRSAAPLASGVPRNELYEWAGGQLKLVSILAANEAGEELPAPTGPALVEQPLLGTLFGVPPLGTARRAISADGSRIVFESGKTLYLRDTAIGKSVQIDAPEPGCPQGAGEGECEEGGKGRFQIASTDGSRVFFTDAHRLTSDSGAKTGEPDLYECRISVNGEGKLVCALSDLTPKEGEESANVQGDVLGASEDGSSIYFVADGTLGGAGAQRGECVNDEGAPQQPQGAQCNLYMGGGGQGTKLVARLSGGDAKDWTQASERQPTRVSPNGQYLSFMSERPLTGYDNTDAVSGKPDAEIFLDDAAGAGNLRCASCDPTGARPVGVEYGKLEAAGAVKLLPAVHGEWEGSGWIAALVPPGDASGQQRPPLLQRPGCARTAGRKRHRRRIRVRAIGLHKRRRHAAVLRSNGDVRHPLRRLYRPDLLRHFGAVFVVLGRQQVRRRRVLPHLLETNPGRYRHEGRRLRRPRMHGQIPVHPTRGRSTPAV
jgi:DNA-binding beta-propeller fold protein YncE